MEHRSDVGRSGCSENESCSIVLYFLEFSLHPCLLSVSTVSGWPTSVSTVCVYGLWPTSVSAVSGTLSQL